jgi:hypothetical protein
MRTVHLAAALVFAGAVTLAADASAQSEINNQRKKVQTTTEAPVIVVAPSVVFGSQGGISGGGSVRPNALTPRASKPVKIVPPPPPPIGTVRGGYKFVKVLQGKQAQLLRESGGIAARLARMEAREQVLASVAPDTIQLHVLQGQILALWHIGNSDNNQAAAFQVPVGQELNFLAQQAAVTTNPSLPGIVGGLQSTYSFFNSTIQANQATYKALTVSF